MVFIYKVMYTYIFVFYSAVAINPPEAANFVIYVC